VSDSATAGGASRAELRLARVVRVSGKRMRRLMREAGISGLMRRKRWPSRRELAGKVFEYIEALYNRQHRHSTLGHLAPLDYQNSALGQPRAGLAASWLMHSRNKIKA
jgi:transposase InsO family protein